MTEVFLVWQGPWGRSNALEGRLPNGLGSLLKLRILDVSVAARANGALLQGSIPSSLGRAPGQSHLKGIDKHLQRCFCERWGK